MHASNSRWRFAKERSSLLAAGEWEMRALVLGALLLASLASTAEAQLVVGPVPIKNNVNGVPITVSTTSWVTVNSAGNDVIVDARIFADLIDLQREFSSVVDTLKLAADNCAKRSLDNQNAVVSLKRGSLWPLDDHLIMSIRGDIDIWSCIAGPLKTEIRWQKKKFAFIKMKVPLLHTWIDLTRNKDGSQQFHGSLPIYLVGKDNATVALKIAKPVILLDGQEVTATDANLRLAKADINRKAHSALRHVVELAKLKQVLPVELQKLNMTVVSARFRDHGGHAVAEIDLAARVSRESISQLLRQIAASTVDRQPNPTHYSLR
jgi:hypothetical protein